MEKTLAFDIYGTLINPYGITQHLSKYVGEQATLFAAVWREKQLQYFFRRGLMNNYQDFTVCTRQAFEFTYRVLRIDLPANTHEELIQAYGKLPAFSDVGECIRALKKDKHKCYAFSNGTYQGVKKLLTYANILQLFDGIISVDAVKSYKPAQCVYQHFLTTTGATLDNTWLISSNAFDIIGAAHSKWHTIWLKRDPDAVFDPWEIKPEHVVSDLYSIASILTQEK